ncbi:class I SAM-dependent methyltransferase [Limibaculum sp. FT325]|uniref:class I SAM-dependent methyltransferase n=1 Tax=Thermohalobaculum sediminis TaxID=2939436 RepID=UPI0020BF5963|nr:class I SAM-dependent methyltransferase [Limibaculum sediminis]MCL5777079.1 class I SAM-dependent methyltransferase [Limibaculum sediminis]
MANNQERPDIFDEAGLVTRRMRAMRLGYADGADFLMREVADLIGERIADVRRPFGRAAVAGTGAGLVPRALARAGVERMVATDPVPGDPAQGGADLIPWGQGVLPFEPAAHDLAVSALLMHALNDPVGHLVQLRHALRPDGLMIAALFGGQTLAELRAALAQAEAELTGTLAARVAPMGEIRDLGALLQRAGFAMPVADAERLTVTYETPLHLMRELRAMGESGILAGRRPLRRDVLARACALYAEHFPAGQGRVRATFEVVFLTGWAPGPGQPVAKRPGSATARLADALGTTERKAGEKAGPG